MLPEIQEYFRAMEGYDREYDREYVQMETEFPVPHWNPRATEAERNAYFEADEKRQIALIKVEQGKKARQAATIQTLMNSDDKLIKWLMTDRVITRDYGSYRDSVLRALPMDREAIDSFGDRQGWCGDYSRLLERANAAGILPEPTPDIADIDDLVRDIRNNYGGSRVQVRAMVKRHLPAILESAKTKEIEATAAAMIKAETETPVTPEVETSDATNNETPADVFA